jgi:uncharacterized membrane protein
MNSIKALFYKNGLQTHYIFLILILFAGIIFVNIIPPLWGVDETSHFYRTIEISQGHIRAEKISAYEYGGLVPSAILVLDQYRDKSLTSINYSLPVTEQHALKSYPDAYRTAINSNIDSPESLAIFSNTAAYSPIAYAGPIIGTWVGEILNTSVGNTILLARYSSLLFYALLAFCALYLLRKSLIRWLFFVIALLPMAVFQASIINADSTLIGVAILLSALLVRLFTKNKPASPTELALLALTVTSISLIKPDYYPMALIFLLLPTKLWSTPKRAAIYKSLLFSISTILLLLWTYATRGVAGAIAYQEPLSIASSISTSYQLKFILLHPLSYIKVLTSTYFYNQYVYLIGIIGSLGASFVEVPTTVAIVLFMAIFLATFYRDKTAQERSSVSSIQYVAILCLMLLAVLGVFTTLYLTYTPVRYHQVLGVQGRYFTPLILLSLYGLRGILPISINISKRFALVIFPSVSALCLAISASLYYISLH